MATLPFINVGTRDKRSYFNKQHDVNTTSGFGFCQPTLVEYLPADTKVSLQQKEFVRLSPLPCPTFGRIEVKNTTRFIPIQEVCENYDYLQSAQTVNNASRNYRPEQVDNMKSNELFHWLICQSIGSFNVTQGIRRIPFFRAAIFTNGKVTTSDPVVSNDVIEDATIGRNLHSSYFRDILNSEQAKTTYARYYSGWSFLNMLCRGTGGEWYDSPLAQAISNYTGVTKWYGLDQEQLASFTRPKLAWFLDHVHHPASVNPSSPHVGDYPYNDQSEQYSVGNMYKMVDAYNMQSPFYAVPKYILQEFTDPISLENADYQIKFEVTGKEWKYLTDGQTSADTPQTFSMGSDSYTVILCLRLTSVGRKLLTVLNACDFKFGLSYKQSLLPLFAYYKAWFDEYNAGRNFHWKNTNCYTLIHSNYDSGFTTQSFLLGGNTSQFVLAYRNRVITAFFGFLQDLTECYYCQPIDNITAATETPLLEISNNSPSLNSVDVYSSNTDTSSPSHPYVTDNTIYGYDRGSTLELAGGLGIKLLNRIYHLVNKNSVIGAKIDDYLKTHFGYGLPESNKLGENNFFCAVSDVMSTAGTEETYLAEYAGKGIGGNHDPENHIIAPTHHFDAKVPGYLISFLCVVPHGGYSQGAVSHPVARYDFYQSEFDSLGMQPMKQSEVLAVSPFLEQNEDYTFGFVPRYYNLKIKNNLVNGGFAQRSQRAQFLPYMLDRIFTENEFVASNDNAGLDFIDSPTLVADESLRYIGSNEKYGNFDRIFYDTTGLTDNFIIHIINDFKQWSPMKAISNSYETYDDEIDTSDRSVERS